jgi:hypothetical protein
MLAEKGNARSMQTILWWTHYSQSVLLITGVVFSNLTQCYGSLTTSSLIQVHDASHAAPYMALVTVFTQEIDLMHCTMFLVGFVNKLNHSMLLLVLHAYGALMVCWLALCTTTGFTQQQGN